MSEPVNRTWKVTTVDRDVAETETVTAAYHQFADSPPFIVFKDAQHRTVYTVNANYVFSIRAVDD